MVFFSHLWLEIQYLADFPGGAVEAWVHVLEVRVIVLAIVRLSFPTSYMGSSWT